MNTRMRSFIASALATTLMAFSAASYADDTEIYFAKANVDNEENQTVANVMIMLDTSGSMRFCENELSGGSGYNANWCSDAANRRINILQNALDQLLDSVSPSIRLGIGRFNYIAPNSNNGSGGTGQIGGRILVPVTELTPDTKSLIRSQIAALNGAGNSSSASAANAQPVGDTPTAAAFSEAARYMMGFQRQYGIASNGAGSTICAATSTREVCNDVQEWGERYSITQSQYNNCPSQANCTRTGNSNNRSYWRQDPIIVNRCTSESYCTTELPILDGSRYVSPMNMANQCETNHIILFTDGAPSANDRPAVSDVVNTNCSAPNWQGSGGTESYTCQVRIASYLNSDSNGKGRKVLTHNIGLYMGNNKDDMETVSDAGGGATNNADSAEELIEAFINNLDLIDGQSRSISAPGIAVNTMNRFQHLDELYYAVFQPAESSYWEGNLKSYRLADQTIRGQNGSAIDPSTGYFKPEAKSYWSTEIDGADAQKGGAREQVTGTGRNLFYSTAGGATLKLNWGSGRTAEPSNTFFGLSNSNNPGNAERAALFARLQTMWGDPMHSVPLMVNYGGEQNYVFVSTNGGMLHIIDTKDGSEAATFMPNELFKQATKFTTQRPPLRLDNTRQIYGLDASWVAWRKPGEKVTDAPTAVYLYGGMRRGGKHFYALDVTNPSSPKLKWQINAGDTGFNRLGQTWSTPTLTRIPTGEDSSVPALVFGGGYSPDDHDNHKNRQSADAMGNTVYIVNAETGELIWSASHADMKWAIPGGVSVVDADFDGVADHLYFADLGGQVFRTDLQNGNRSVHRIAELGGSGADHRRFYEAPSVAYVKQGAENHLYVAVASGYRAHPLDEATNEGLFVVVDKDALGTSTSAIATTSNMANVASNQEMDPDTHRGWYYLFQTDTARPGEKALASPVIFDNTILLSTYAPTMDQEQDNPCAVRYGAAYLHSVDLRSGAPKSLNKDAPAPLTRSEELAQSTPPPTPTIMVDEDGKIVVLVGTEIVDDDELNDPNLRKRRWMQLPKDEAGQILPPTEAEG